MVHHFPDFLHLCFRAYLTTHKATEEDLAYVAVKNHDNGLSIQRHTSGKNHSRGCNEFSCGGLGKSFDAALSQMERLR
jgi:hypothetical protein